MRRMTECLSRIFLLVFLAAAVFLSGCKNEQAFEGIEATGHTEMTETLVSSKVEGKVVKILVEEGQLVQKGDLLVELDHEELDAQIDALKSNLELAKLRYKKSIGARGLVGSAKANEQSRQAQIEMAKNNLREAKTNWDDTVNSFKRMQQLFQEGVISKAEYDRAYTQKEVGEAKYQAALNNLTMVRFNPETDDLDTVVKQSDAQIKKAESELALLEIQQNNTQITAPVAGVISEKLIQLGELVRAGASLFTILNYSQPWVKIYLPLKEVERVFLNTKAYAIMDAFPDQKVYGRVIFISQEAEFTPKDYISKEERVKQVFAVKIGLENQEAFLKPGLPVDIFIETGKKSKSTRSIAK
jgi:HlyD family secretion protein